MDLFGLNGAEFSEDRKYRYALWRVWDEQKNKLIFIGLNPSSADEQVNDRTTHKVMHLANSWGFGGVYLLNVFAYITPYPEELYQSKDPIGENDEKLAAYSPVADDVLFAWGANDIRARETLIFKLFPKGYCIGQNQDGSPKHPLYAAKNTELKRYEVPNLRQSDDRSLQE